MGHAGFLDLPRRDVKPRTFGLTHVLDHGMPLARTRELIDVAGEFVDIWKFGWGTAYLDPAVAEKVALLRRHDIQPCVGGTLLEIAWAQGRAQACLDWAARSGFPLVEVSNGALGISGPDKRRLITAAATQFTVLAEVGSKDPLHRAVPGVWGEEMVRDLEAGAAWVIAEGRESGTVGLYEADGSVREDVVSAVVDRVGATSIIFEAPKKSQQAWFIRHLGSNVSLGNVDPDRALALEALRLGLRADTVEVLARDPLEVAPGWPGT